MHLSAAPVAMVGTTVGGIDGGTDLTGDRTVLTVASRSDAAFEAFYRAHRDEIAAALALTCGNVVVGAEAADEAMARALARWASVGAMDNPAGWVYRVGLNWSRSGFRRTRREDLGAPVEELARLDPNIDPDLADAIATLSVDHRSVVVLRYLLEYSSAETAEALGISEGTVKSRLSRALDQLRARLDER